MANLLERATGPRADLRRFDPDAIASLPHPIRRWLLRSIVPGSRLPRATWLEMDGDITLAGRWLPFRAVEVLAPPEGFVWAARVGWGPLSVVGGFDRYVAGTGELRWRLGGLVPLVHATGDDVDQSAAGRLVAEAMLVPTNVLMPGVECNATAEPDTATCRWAIGVHTISAEVHVDAEGQPRAVTMTRWGNPDGKSYGAHRFSALLSGQATFGGITITTQLRAGWFDAADSTPHDEFFRATITNATFD